MLWLECMVTLLILALVSAFWLSFRWLETLSFYFMYSVLLLAILNKVRCWNWHFVSFLPEVHCLHLTWITTLLSGVWVPGVSRSFHFWQQSPDWRMPVWLAQWCNPGNKRHLSQWKYRWRKKHWEEGREEELIERNLVTGTTQLEGNSMYISESLEGCIKLLGMYMCMLTYHGPIAHC